MTIPVIAIIALVAWAIISCWFLFWKSTSEQKTILNRIIAKTKIGALDWSITETTMNEECYEAVDEELGLEYSFYNWGSGSGIVYDHRFLHIWSVAPEGSYHRDYKYHVGITPAHLLKQLEDEIVTHLGMSARTRRETEDEARTGRAKQSRTKQKDQNPRGYGCG